MSKNSNFYWKIRNCWYLVFSQFRHSYCILGSGKKNNRFISLSVKMVATFGIGIHVSFDIISACVKHQINFIHSSLCVFLKSHEKKDENVCMFVRSVICQNALFFPLYNLERLVVIPIEDEKPRNKVLVKFRKTNAVCMWKMQMEFIYHRCEFSCKPFHFQHTVAKT